MSPYLICKHAERLTGLLKDVFGGVLLRKLNRPDGSLMHAEVGIDDGAVMISSGTTEFHTQRRISLFGTTAAVSQQISDGTIKTDAIDPKATSATMQQYRR
jgi:uncharacterized glyoxalase superfamily protein PhnB